MVLQVEIKSSSLFSSSFERHYPAHSLEDAAQVTHDTCSYSHLDWYLCDPH